MISESPRRERCQAELKFLQEIKAKFIMTKNTLTKTKSSRNRVAFVEGGQGIGLEFR